MLFDRGYLALIRGEAIKVYLAIIEACGGLPDRSVTISLSRSMTSDRLSCPTVIDCLARLEELGLVVSTTHQRGKVKTYYVSDPPAADEPWSVVGDDVVSRHGPTDDSPGRGVASAADATALDATRRPRSVAGHPTVSQRPLPMNSYFFRVEHDLLRSEAFKTLGGSAIKVYLVIGLYSDFGTDWAYPSIRTIARQAGLSRQTVLAAIEQLTRMGLLATSKAKGRSTAYRIIRQAPRTAVAVASRRRRQAGRKADGYRSKTFRGSPSRVSQNL